MSAKPQPPAPRDSNTARSPRASKEQEESNATPSLWNRLSAPPARLLLNGSDDMVIKANLRAGRRGTRGRRKSSENHLSAIERAEAGLRWNSSPEGQQRSSRTRKKKGPNWKDGNAAMETPEMQARRQALRCDPAVSAVLDAWWEQTDADKNGVIDRNEYIELGQGFGPLKYSPQGPLDARTL